MNSKYLVQKIHRLIYYLHHDSVKLLFKELDPENILYGILTTLIFINGIDLIRFIIENSITFDFLATEIYAN